MQVALVQSAAPGCDAACTHWIAAQGMIDAAAVAQFKAVLKTLGNRKLPILLNSDGGSVDDSLAIGRLIRAKGLDVAIAATVFKPCPANDLGCRQPAKRTLPGVATMTRARCASACAFILAGGVNRYVGPHAVVGVHQFRSFHTTAQVLRRYRIFTRPTWSGPQEVRRELISEKRVNVKTVETRTPDSAYADVSRYFAEMGITPAIMPMVKATPSTTMRWLTRAELTSTRMETHAIEGVQLVTGTLAPLIQPDQSAVPAPTADPVRPAAPAPAAAK
jgi:hypothetical protein